MPIEYPEFYAPLFKTRPCLEMNNSPGVLTGNIYWETVNRIIPWSIILIFLIIVQSNSHFRVEEYERIVDTGKN